MLTSNEIMRSYNTIKLHQILFYVDMNKLLVNIIIAYVDINHIACKKGGGAIMPK